ncbi:hypothetical protein A11Q_1458 [Pseudobdellovibrio exovorus JSS]|uniref:Uncharacterized protein n=1 Tax=Pseudobdellovibrio exovorus JSS TaxID=1184267 RepID=M4VR70_9BACT|nr:hypothetical protein A11Q_1458 [Pseudobdellovibrio exovorus JSS]
MDNKWACYFVRNSVQSRLTVFLATEEYTVWYKKQSPKVRAQIDGRLLNIAEHGSVLDSRR